MPSPTKDQLLAERAFLRDRIAALEAQIGAHQQAREVAAALSQVGKEIAESLDVSQVTDRIVTAVLQLLRGQRAALFQLESPEGALICVATAGPGDRDKWLGRRLAPGEGIAGWAVLDGHAVWATNLLTDPRLTLPEFSRERIREEGFRASVGVPLIARGAVIGALVLNDAGGRHFSEDDLEILTFFADQAAVALENARLYEEERGRREHIEAVRAVGRELIRELDLSTLLKLIVRRAAELVSVKSGVLWLWDETARTLVPRSWHGLGDWIAEGRLGLGEGAAGVAAATREGLILDEYRTSPLAHPLILEHTDITAVLSEPLIYHNRLLGVLSLDNAGTGRTFGERDRQSLQLLAAHAAIALENARLYEEVQRELVERTRAEVALIRRTQQLEAVREVTAEITRELDLTALLGVIIRGAMGLVGAVSGAVYLWDETAQVLVPQAWHGYGDWMRSVRVHLDEGVVGTVARRRTGLRVDDYRSSPFALPVILQHTTVTMALGQPLLYQDRLLGVIVINSDESRQVFAAEDEETLALFAAQAAVAIENARLYTAVQHELRERRRAEETLVVRTRQLEAVRAVTAEITQELDLDALLALIHRRAVELLDGRGGIVYLWEEAAQRLVPKAWHGVPDAIGGQSHRIGEGVAGRVADLRSGLIVNGYRTSPYAFPSVLEQTAITAVLAEPLLYGDRLLGVIGVDDGGTNRVFTNQDRETLALFAAQAAVAIENARLFVEARRRQEELTALLRASRSVMAELDLQRILERIVAEAAQISGCSHVKILLVDRAAGVLRVGALQGTAMADSDRLPLGVGHSGIVAQTGEPLFVADAPSDPRNVYAQRDRELGLTTFLGIPVKSRGAVLGVLSFNTTVPHLYTPDELAYLTSFADQAAIAIENARLFAELNQSYRDLQQAQDELIRSEKLRALGQMAAGIAHDLNNMLAAVLGQVELLRLRAPDRVTREALKTLETAATDGAHVVRRLQEFARQRPRLSLSPVDLGQAVEEALEITRPRWRDEPQRLGRVIEARTMLDGLPHILGHAPEIREVLINLILNAVDAMPQGGTLALAGRAVAALRGQQGTGQWVELTVSDTGCGMTEEVRRRIFEPFFTTKGMHGTGLGLSVVYGIMERHRGRIQVVSAPGQGTTFTLRFEAVPPQAAVAPPVAAATLPARRRILLIDDDPGVRQTLGSLLRAVGHQVVEAAGGADGLARFAEGAVDLVLTDLGMPEMNGWEVARAVKAASPRLPVVLLTGWGEHASAEADAARAREVVNRILGKPFRLEELLRTIGDLTPRAAADSEIPPQAPAG